MLSVFEVGATASGPCEALASSAGERLGEEGWEASFLTQEELLAVLDCRLEGEDVLHEGTGRLLAGAVSRFGWELYQGRTSSGGIAVSVTGVGSVELMVGERAGERVAPLEMDVRHQSGQHGVDSVVGLEGAWGTGRVLVVHRRVGAGLSAPWVCVAIELR